MTALNKQALRQLATDAHELGIIKRYTKGIEANKRFVAIATPLTVLALLDELEAKDVALSSKDYHFDQDAGRIKSLEKELESAERRIAELEAIREVFLRAKALMYQSGGAPIENSLNPIDAWLYDAELAATGIGVKGE